MSLKALNAIGTLNSSSTKGCCPNQGCVARQRPRPDRSSAKVPPAGCQLAAMALQTKTGTVPKGGSHGRSYHPTWDVSAFWAELHETGGLSATLAINRLGRCRATRPRVPPHNLSILSPVVITTRPSPLLETDKKTDENIKAAMIKLSTISPQFNTKRRISDKINDDQ